MLAQLLSQWDLYRAGLQGEVMQVIGLGNYERDDWDMQKGMPVFSYTVEEQFRVAVDTAETYLLKQEEQRLLREGPWMVRMGLSKPRPALSAQDQAWIDHARSQAAALLRQVQAMGQWTVGTGSMLR